MITSLTDRENIELRYKAGFMKLVFFPLLMIMIIIKGIKIKSISDRINRINICSETEVNRSSERNCIMTTVEVH